MGFGDLIPWSRGSGQAPTTHRETEQHPFLSLHREMNRLFDDVFRGLDGRAPRSDAALFGGTWPNIEVTEADNEFRVTAEVPGLEEKDIEVLLEDGVLTLRGEKRSEVADTQTQFSERYYGRFERRLAIGTEIEHDKVEAAFKNGVLSVKLPKTARAQTKAKRIAIKS